MAWAACCANESVYNLLLDSGAHPDYQDNFGNMILHMVVVCDKLVKNEIVYSKNDINDFSVSLFLYKMPSNIFKHLVVSSYFIQYRLLYICFITPIMCKSLDKLIKNIFNPFHLLKNLNIRCCNVSLLFYFLLCHRLPYSFSSPLCILLALQYYFIPFCLKPFSSSLFHPY